jgi:ribonuclease T
MDAGDFLRNKPGLQQRFRGFLPVVIDVETSGIDPNKNAILELCAVLIEQDDKHQYHPGATFAEHLIPFEGAVMDPASLAFNQIDPDHPLRFAIDERTALKKLIQPIKNAVKKYQCQRAVLVGHNAWFDLLFLKQAFLRNNIDSPFHAFTCFDTATLSGFIYGQTVLSKAMKAANINFDTKEAHSAIYDAKKTAELFCHFLNIIQTRV